MATPLKTPAVAKLIGTTCANLLSMIRNGKMAPPRKDTSNHYCWTSQDVEAARAALAADRRFRQFRQRKQAASA